MEVAWSTIPQVTQFDSADITKLFKLYKKIKTKLSGTKFSLISFYIKVLTKMLREFPSFNSSLSNNKDSVVLKKYINVGVAVDTDKGLLVPVIKNCEKKSLIEINDELNDLGKKAHLGNLKVEDLEGGTITISSLGGIGGTNFTPIVNPPQVAILGFSKAQDQLILKNGKITKGLILPFSLSYDHRLIDGAEAVKFTTKFKENLSSIRLNRKNK